jgi:hypothetical protein
MVVRGALADNCGARRIIREAGQLDHHAGKITIAAEGRHHDRLGLRFVTPD